MPSGLPRDPGALRFLEDKMAQMLRDGLIQPYEECLAQQPDSTRCVWWVGGQRTLVALDPARPRVVSPLGVVPKQDAGWRIIVNLSWLNGFCTVPTFRHESIDTVAAALRPSAWLVKIDLKDGFFHVPVAREYRPLLGIQWRGRYYTWTVLPMGLRASPLVFTKCLRPAIKAARAQGLTLACYVDDILLVAATQDQARQHRDVLLRVLADFGWVINPAKSVIEPTHVLTFLGFRVDCSPDLPTALLTLTPERRRALCALVRRALRGRNNTTSRILASVVGSLQAVTRAVHLGPLHLRHLYAAINPRSWDARTQLSDEAFRELQWWLSEIKTVVGRPPAIPAPEWLLATDASGEGWGAALAPIPRGMALPTWTPTLQLQLNQAAVEATSLQSPHNQNDSSSSPTAPAPAAATSSSSSPLALLQQKITHQGASFPRHAQGRFAAEQRAHLSSNKREMLAVLYAVQSFRAWLRSTSVLIVTDNSTTQAVINKRRSYARDVNDLAITLHAQLEAQALYARASWAPGVTMTVADSLSRHFASAEWMLNPAVFRAIDRRWGPHTVDRFATSLNRQLRRFNSALHDPETEAVDAMAQDWSRDNNWVNPPFAMIGRVVDKILAERARATLVVPMWPTSPWWARTMAAASAWRRLPSSEDTFLLGSAGGAQRTAPPWPVFAVRI